MVIYNTLTRQKEQLIPLNENEIKIYACGPTVYNYFHIGNARPLIIFDTLRRYLKYLGYKVTFVQNFTDIDDKIIKRAGEEKISVSLLADKFIKEYFVDAKGLGVLQADFHPKATENIDGIIEMICTLIDKGYAYESNSDVYFSALKFKEYGKLSHQPLDDLEAGSRVNVNEIKENPTDFALWKKAKENEPFWHSPWGNGRPGWHIECSVMANKYLGKTIDIHCGGIDLIFPHHENEIAQSEAANGCEFARYWMHNGFINVDNQKMSKSKNNFFTVRDVITLYDYEVIRFFMLSAHYRSPINYSPDILEQSKAGLERLYNCKNNIDFLLKTAKDEKLSEFEAETLETFLSNKKRFKEAMDDDLNTADAVSVLFDLAKAINVYLTNSNSISKALLLEFKGLFLELASVLGLLSNTGNDSLEEQVEQLIEQRQKARKDKNFVLADSIRDELKAKGIVLEDTSQGVKWKKV